MLEVRQTEAYSTWFAKLKDQNARLRILARLRRLELGNPGDVKAVGEGVSELRVDCGPGGEVHSSGGH
jgi:putative addiction module killer protein